LYQAQVDQLNQQLQDNVRTIEELRETRNFIAVKEANPLELLDEESDEILSGSRKEVVRKEVLPVHQSRITRESHTTKKVSPPSHKLKKVSTEFPSGTN